MRHLWTVVSLLVVVGPCMGGDSRATRKADAWIGRDAQDLLTQLRVDGGRVTIDESDTETSYSWENWNPAWRENVCTSSHQQMVGMTPSTPTMAGTPIFQNQCDSYQTVHHPAVLRCRYTFVANADGLISHWTYQGNNCNWEVPAPKSQAK